MNIILTVYVYKPNMNQQVNGAINTLIYVKYNICIYMNFMFGCLFLQKSVVIACYLSVGSSRNLLLNDSCHLVSPFVCSILKEKLFEQQKNIEIIVGNFHLGCDTVNLEIFRENFIYQNSVKRHICHVKNSQLLYDLHTSVNNSDFSILREFYFHKTSKMGNFEKIKPLRKFSNLQYITGFMVANSVSF